MQTGVEAETIYAVATAPGRAAISVIRVSGPAVHEALLQLSGEVPPPRVASLRTLTGHDGVIDQALVLRFEAPNSFTGEDVAEFHIHGGRAVQGALLRALGSMPRLRPAAPGEFTRRALLNGKLDLTQAEAVADLIDSDTDRQRAQALGQLGGGLARVVAGWRDLLIEASALIEAALDFSDEHDVGESLPPAVREAVVAVTNEIAAQLQKRGAERLRDGFTVVIAGPPNAGKSTLLNWWAGREAAIVTPIPGTTRDLIEVDLELDGLPVRLIDTAGLHAARDIVEQIGMDRARDRARSADLVLWLDPGGGSVDDELADRPTVRVRSKVDSVPERSSKHGELAISVLAGTGLNELHAEVIRHLGQTLDSGGVLTRERHRLALQEAAEHLGRAERSHDEGGPVEFIAEDLRLALRSLDGLIGRVTSEDILDKVFSSFCIGK